METKGIKTTLAELGFKLINKCGSFVFWFC